MTILITGANGNVSSAVLRSLAPRDDLRVLVRDAAKAPAGDGLDVVVGDLEEPRTLGAAFEGVDTVWLLNAMGPAAPHASMNAVWAARRAGVRHVVRMSAVGAAHDAPTRNGRLHVLSDIELMASGLAWTIIRPHFFMQNMLGAVMGDTLYGFVGDGRLGAVDVRDIGDFAARVLADPAPHAGKVYTLTGPDSFSMHEAAKTLESVLDAPITYQALGEQDAYQALLGAGLPDWVAAVSAEYGTAYAGGWGDFTTSDFADVVGRPPRSFADFARDHANHLRVQ
ncbi:nucleotide-diphosphate-sugar epimerase [Sphaerisporangium rufum]|uniref:Nucleotide-diphosphate-sugar epimerase n=1 Tax=Sphaerisporangium rufum TaxID=1381558 RepID=A0A919R5W2_9ACTN|nr:SDR family oxidoreductase [Sphaerisporangium rufum]GII80229.1 nucleotide-diphosphate-sugar epimerase [Sphaerisporangium rufum]